MRPAAPSLTEDVSALTFAIPLQILRAPVLLAIREHPLETKPSQPASENVQDESVDHQRDEKRDERKLDGQQQHDADQSVHRARMRGV